MSHPTHYIETSKYKCRHVYALDPTTIPVLTNSLSSEQLKERQLEYGQSLSTIREFMQKLISFLSGTPTYIVTTDAEGHVLDSYGDDSIQRMVTTLGIRNGIQFHEEEAGTNSIILALKYGEPIQLIGDDHYHDCFRNVACFSVPFTIKKGETAGTVSLMTSKDHASEFHLGLLSSAVDSIEREINTQKQNQELHINNQVLMDTTPLGIVITNKDGVISSFNKSAEMITGREKASAVGEMITILPDISPCFLHVLKEQEPVENVEITFSEHHKTVLFDILPLFNEGILIGAFGQFKDVTSYIELQNQVVQSEKLSAIGKLSAGFAHEIRNPLTSIIGLTKILDVDVRQAKHMEIIKSELERIDDLVNEFVLYGKPGGSQKKNCDLVTIISDTVKLMRCTAKKQKVNLYFKDPGDHVPLYIDQSQFKQVLINLINNSIDAMSEGGDIEIGLTFHDSEVVITINDEGSGMSKEEIENFGIPFYSTKDKGLGIGLSICSDIVKSHNGTISVGSSDETGTSIHISIPYDAKRRPNIS
ncbi:ATP-binding protein [Alkalihalobacillus sp. CinArs1]|uniref:ATP-binding protein n=1 Tax=Alkalihalobacillus sp. CinArs1 TaxID=2995314 RepID=UPI0022DE41E3|nr:ATP-binding protein [Alkalihalobacillus sp. CinArs1]